MYLRFYFLVVIVILSQVENTTSTDRITVLSGATVYLHCNCKQPVMWYWNNNTLKQNISRESNDAASSHVDLFSKNTNNIDNKNQNKNILKIENFSHEKNGVYTCFEIDESGKRSKFINSTIIETQASPPIPMFKGTKCLVWSNLSQCECHYKKMENFYYNDNYECIFVSGALPELKKRVNICKNQTQYTNFTLAQDQEDMFVCTHEISDTIVPLVNPPNFLIAGIVLVNQFGCYNFSNIFRVYQNIVGVVPQITEAKAISHHQIEISWKDSISQIFTPAYLILVRTHPNLNFEKTYTYIMDNKNGFNRSYIVGNLQPSTPYVVSIQSKVLDTREYLSEFGELSEQVTVKTLDKIPEEMFKFVNLLCRMSYKNSTSIFVWIKIIWQSNISNDTMQNYKLSYKKNDKKQKEVLLPEFKVTETFSDISETNSNFTLEGEICNNSGCSETDSFNFNTIHKYSITSSSINLLSLSDSVFNVSIKVNPSSKNGLPKACMLYLIKSYKFKKLNNETIISAINEKSILYKKIFSCQSINLNSFQIYHTVSSCFNYYAVITTNYITTKTNFETISSFSKPFTAHQSFFFPRITDAKVLFYVNNKVLVTWRYEFCSELEQLGMKLVLFYKAATMLDSSQNKTQINQNNVNCINQQIVLDVVLIEAVEYQFYLAKCCGSNLPYQHCQQISETIYLTKIGEADKKISILLIFSVTLIFLFLCFFIVLGIKNRKQIVKYIQQLIIPLSPKPLLLVDLNSSNNQCREVVDIETVHEIESCREIFIQPQTSTDEDVPYASNYISASKITDFQESQGYGDETGAFTQPFKLENEMQDLIPNLHLTLLNQEPSEQTDLLSCNLHKNDPNTKITKMSLCPSFQSEDQYSLNELKDLCGLSTVSTSSSIQKNNDGYNNFTDLN